MKKVISLLLFVTLAGCSYFQMDRSEEAALQNKRLIEERDLHTAQETLVAGNFAQAQKQYKLFQETYPVSSFYQASRIGEAQALEGQGKWVEAAAIYRDVILKTRNLQPDIAALALYRNSFCEEALGDDQKTVANLLEAQSLRTALPMTVGYAEIPARLASAYSRIGREKEANKYLNEAEQGIAKIRKETDPAKLDKDWLVKTYVQMGSVSTNQLSAENFESFVASQKYVQIYLIRALELNNSRWSPTALKQLQTTYNELYLQVEAVKQNRSQQANLGGSLVELIDSAELYRPLAGQTPNSYQIEFFTLTSDIRKKTERLLYQGHESMGLTEESKKLNSIKRSGRTKADALLPEEQGSSKKMPSKPAIGEDPNL
ncbi:tetratricopeptide repeat protein [Bdellovibrio sp. HCB209]|uniref:tetratricopeptide repeat protein n=1 Tax=Bdellovibrio sp. HCB209 TaxID=3394354 RepID=UPI0039B53DFF